MSRTPSVRAGQPVLVGSTVGHLSRLTRDSITVLEGPPLPPEMIKAYRALSVTRLPWTS